MAVPRPSESLWSWSLRTLEVPEARQALLILQDAHGVSGSLTLWAGWCERAGLSLSESEAERIIASVHGLDRYAVRRLREVRRYAASPRPGFDGAGLAALRQEVYQAELAAERLIQERLETDTLSVCALDGDDPSAGLFLMRLCAAALETPVMLADDLVASGPLSLFATLMAHAPVLERRGPASKEAG